uniref:non-ribosomal peptide synthetase n=1 Tax=Herbidospora sakaeratensis TaxID=564415 RepID=UPI0007826464|nr:non-ribosomal peptide synthetase [Herbidospora sakaeratensis]
MSPIEWLYLGMGPNVIQHVFEGDGDLGVEALVHAVEAASEACPGMRLRQKGRRWVDSGVAPEVRVLDVDPGHDLLSEPALQTALYDGGPTCEVLLVPGRRVRPTTLVFRAFHGVTDARGLLLWIADVFRVLRGVDPVGATSDWNSDDFLRHLRPTGLPPIPPGEKDLVHATSMAPVPPGRHGLIWRRRSVDGVCAAPTARVVAAVAASADPPVPGRFLISVDLRRHRPELRSTAWLSQILPLTVEPDGDWEEVHQALLTGLAENRELLSRTSPAMRRLPRTIVREIFTRYEASAAKRHRYLASGIVTSLGFVDLADYSAGGFRAEAMYTLGSLVSGAPVSLDVVETAGRTELVATWRDVPGAAERMDDLLDRLVEALSPQADRYPAANDTWRPSSTASLLELFRRQAELTPDALALSWPEGTMSYAELSRRADAVATGLRARGAGRGDVVGVLAERTPAAVAAIWGILRAGAAYLPLDVLHPDSRLADLLSDAGVKHCLAQAPHDARDAFPAGCAVLDLDDAVTATPDGAPDPETAADDLAYVLYTSGSTGKPKGVQIEHGSLLNYLHWGVEEFGVDADTRLPLLTSLSFDVSGTSIFMPLITGGGVVLVRDQPNHLTLRRLLMESGATMLNLTPSHLELIGRLEIAPTGFRSIVVVGEQLRVEVAARAQEMFGPGCRVINEYGPTEATIGCTAHTFDPARDGGRSTVPIGVPARNTQVHLLDPTRRFVAEGEVGEMYLAGVQLARGYLGRPDLDEERFPRLVDGTRTYRTGDLARRLPDGGLEFLGRIDDQLKIRGHRVEPAEVAAVLEEHPAVDRAVVVARTRAGGSKALCGYVLSRTGVAVADLTAHAADRLPSYMVPAAVFVVDEIPYGISGKVDVRALPDPFAGPATGSGPASADGGDRLEREVGEVWARVLGVEADRIDPHADFHHLGGDSVALLNMLAGVCREVLPPAAEAEFMNRLGRVIAEPTVANVAVIAREVAEV